MPERIHSGAWNFPPGTVPDPEPHQLALARRQFIARIRSYQSGPRSARPPTLSRETCDLEPRVLIPAGTGKSRLAAS
jgi:hypothetical protein